MAALIHEGVWSTSPTWPGGLRDGDLAFLVWRYASGTSLPELSPSAPWRSVASYRYQSGASRYRGGLYYSWVQAGQLPALPDVSSNVQAYRLLVVRDTQGVGRTRSGIAMAPVLAGGGVLAFGPGPTGTGDLTILPDSGGPLAIGWAGPAGEGTVGNSGWSHRSVRAVELLPPRGPQAPLILAPGDGDEVAGTGEVEFGWQHRGVVQGGRQDAYQLRAWDYTSDELYWSASVGDWTVSEATNTSGTQGVVLPSDAFQLGVEMWWQVRTREGVDGRWSVWSPTSSFTPVSPPTVNVTGPGDVHDDLSPTVTWAASTPRGGQSAFRVQVARLGEVLYDSGVIPGGGSEWIVPPREWVNGGLYQARVQVQQTGGSWSAWSTRDFTITWTEPAIPQVDVWSTRQGVLVQVAADPGLAVDLERITGEGLWLPVGSFTMPASGVVTVTDVLAPYGQVTAYRARAVNELEGQRLASGWGLSGQVASSARWSYLAAAGDPLRTWVRVYINEDSSRTHQRPVAVAYGLGDTDPRVSYGRLRGQAGTLRLAALDYAGGEALLGLLHAGEPLVLRWPPETGDDPDPEDAGLLVFDVAGELDVARLAQVALQRRYVSVPWVEQEPPVPGSGSNAPVTHPIGGPPGAAAQADNELELEAF